MLEHVRRPLAFLTWQCGRFCVAAASTAAACFQSFSFHTVKPELGALRWQRGRQIPPSIR